MIHQIDTADTEKTTEILLKLADIVDAHVRYEERILFPHVEKVLTEKQLEEIGMHIAGKPLKDNFEDKFWIQPKSL
jgi:hemerythrin-like domain-containing protein